MNKIYTKLFQDVNLNTKNHSTNESVFFTKRQNYNKNTSLNKQRCYNYNRYGHLAKDCRCPKRNPERSNVCDARSDEQETEILWMATHTDIQKNKQDWYIDSGATQHISPIRELFTNYTPISGKIVKTADGRQLLAYGQGDIKIEVSTQDKANKVTLKNVLYVPDLEPNLNLFID